MSPDIKFSPEAVDLLDQIDGKVYRILVEEASRVASDEHAEAVTIEHIRRALQKLIDALKQQQGAESPAG